MIEETKLKTYILYIQYIGTGFIGWQKQKSHPNSIQAHIEKALFKVTGENVEVFGAGRTDSGVHAIKQVAHCQFVKDIKPEKLAEAINFHLETKNIKITKSIEGKENFHARFSAKGRSYIYRINNSPLSSCLFQEYVYFHRKKLNVKKMNKAAKLLVGTHDLSTFRATGCQAKSPIKTINKAYFKQNGDEISFFIEAPSFLYHQVRNIVGTLILVGEEKWSINDFKQAIQAKNRNKGGKTAPAHGLYLQDVKY